jgi:hypothetical protein
MRSPKEPLEKLFSTLEQLILICERLRKPAEYLID